MSSLGLVAGWVQGEGVGFDVRTVLGVLLLQGWTGLVTAHAVHLHQHGCL